ncbi:hypothetical protein KI387_035573, partial [Taxus chinensis]
KPGGHSNQNQMRQDGKKLLTLGKVHQAHVIFLQETTISMEEMDATSKRIWPYSEGISLGSSGALWGITSLWNPKEMIVLDIVFMRLRDDTFRDKMFSGSMKENRDM